MANESLSGKLAVILHADVAGSTALVRQDEQLAHSRIQETFQRFKEIIVEYHGRVHELRGDALLAEFERASDGVSAALAFQSAQCENNEALSDSIRPEVRVGISLGEVVIADGTITGAGVVIAQRLEQQAEPGGLVIQSAAFETIPERFPFEYEYLGDHQAKGFDDPIRSYRVRLKGDSTIPRPQEAKQDSQTGNSRNQFATIVAIVLAVALAAVFWIKPWEPQVEPASVEQMVLPLPDKPSIAVLAFTNLSGDPDKAYLSDGLSENIITELSRFSQFFVIARQSSFSYKDKPVTVKQVSEELGVRYVLEGSIQIAGDRVRVTAQLINALEGNHVWAEKYDKELEDIFSVQDEITSAIVATLKANIDLNEYARIKNKPPRSLNAYEKFTLGLASYFKYTPEGTEQARKFFEEAATLEPDYSDAYRGLTWAYINCYRWGWIKSLDREQCLQLAFENARKAVALGPYNHRAHQALAATLMHAGQLEEAIVVFDRALEMNPNDANMMASTSAPLIYTGRPDEAVLRLGQAIRMNPYHQDWYLWNLGFALYFSGKYEESVAALKQMKKMPNLVRRHLAAAYVRLGQIDQARTVIAEFLENDPDYTIEKVRLNYKGKFSNPDDLERFIEDLRIAGLP